MVNNLLEQLEQFQVMAEDLEKQAYFQGGGGVNKPEPKKKKYKSDRAIVVQPRFKEPLFKNYDLYETEGVDGTPEHGLGAGFYQNMEKYKSISDFRKKKQERNKNKYKSDDSYIEDDGSITKDKIHARMDCLKSFMKTAIDFPIDDLIGSESILGNSGTVSDAVPIGGQTDEYLTNPDFEGKLPTQLDFGRDYTDEDEKPIRQIDKLQDKIDELQEKLDKSIGEIKPKETDLMGLPQGISPPEDLDQPSDEDPDYGTTDSGNTFYNQMWI